MATATTEANGLTTRNPQQLAESVNQANDVMSIVLDPVRGKHLVRLAEVYSKSDLVPKHFQGNFENCFIGVQLAMRMEIDPFMLLQNLYIVHGKPGIEAKLAIALCNSKKVFRGPIRYRLEGEGKARQCTAYATDRETGETLEETVTFEMAEKEGWVSKSGSKWQSLPDLMLKYRSAMWLIRTTCPEVLMGMHSKDELEDMDEPQIVQPQRLERRNPTAEELEAAVGPGVTDGSGVGDQSETEPAEESTFDRLMAEAFAAEGDDEIAAVRRRVEGEVNSGHLTADEAARLSEALSN